MLSTTKNSLELYRGGNPDTIVQLLKFQKSDVVNELKQLCGTNDLKQLAVQLSIGAYTV